MDAICETCGLGGPGANLTWNELDDVICCPGCIESDKRGKAAQILQDTSIGNNAWDALACLDQDVLMLYVEQTWETVSPKGIAVAAAKHWVDILVGEVEDLEATDEEV